MRHKIPSTYAWKLNCSKKKRRERENENEGGKKLFLTLRFVVEEIHFFLCVRDAIELHFHLKPF